MSGLGGLGRLGKTASAFVLCVLCAVLAGCVTTSGSGSIGITTSSSGSEEL